MQSQSDSVGGSWIRLNSKDVWDEMKRGEKHVDRRLG